MKKILAKDFRTFISICSCFLLAFICLAAAGFWYKSHKHNDTAAEEAAGSVLESWEHYDFNIEEVVVSLPGLQQDYTFAWVSDLHLIADVPFTEVCLDVDASAYETVQNRYDNSFVTAEGVHAVELWPQIVDWLNDQELDGVILGGDLLDYYSDANMKAFAAEYERIKAPVIYTRRS